MRPDRLLLMALMLASVAGCGRMDRLSIVRPTAERGDYTHVGQRYEVSEKERKASPVASADLVAGAAGLYQAGQVELAERQAREALKRDPASGDAHTLLAAIADSRGDAAVAGEHYAKASAIAPGNGSYANNYGTWLCANGRASESLAWFERALADPGYPTPVTALANSGTCAERAGNQGLAESSWRRALAIDAVNPASLRGLAMLQFARGRHLEARAFAERWLAVRPMDQEALQMAARIESSLGDKVAAERYLSRLRALPPDSLPASRTQ